MNPMVLVLFFIALWIHACDQTPPPEPPTLKSPSKLVYGPACIDDQGVWLTPDQWDADRCPNVQRAYVIEEESGALAYVSLEGSHPSLIDTRVDVPKKTSVPIGERPRDVVITPDGAWVLTINTDSKDLSVVQVEVHREVLRLPLDQVPMALRMDSENHLLWIAFENHLLQALSWHFQCQGQDQENHYVSGCVPEILRLDVETQVELPGMPIDMILDPVRPHLYVSYQDLASISVLNLQTLPPLFLDPLPGGGSCDDGIDNDGDGGIDALDLQCYGPYGAESPQSAGLWAITPCSNGLDDDGDGWLDLFDPGCLSPNDGSEEEGWQDPEIPTCLNGLDDDGDGWIDAQDPDCFSPNAGETHRNLLSACSDGIDNDGDGSIDMDDPGCSDPQDGTESLPKACNDGIDNDGDGLIDLADWGCASRNDPSEDLSPTECSDGIDNDGNGAIDDGDPNCYGRYDPFERPPIDRGRAPLAIDPQGRWLYVVDRAHLQLVVVDLNTQKVLPIGLRNPHEERIGFPLHAVPTAALGDVREKVLFESENRQTLRQEAVVYVTSTKGRLQVFSVFQHFEQKEGDQPLDAQDFWTLHLGDARSASGSLSELHCLALGCEDQSFPTVTLRQRPGLSIDELSGDIDLLDEKGNPLPTPADEILRSQSWSFVYEGALPNSQRSDGIIEVDEPDALNSFGNFCQMGVRVGDHLVLPLEQNDFKGTSIPECQAFADDQGNLLAFEWKIQYVRAHQLFLTPIQDPAYAPILPSSECFEMPLHFEIIPPGQWTVRGSKTLLGLEEELEEVCLPSNPREGMSRIWSGQPYSNLYFDVTLNQNDLFEIRNNGVRFSLSSGFVPFEQWIGALPKDIQWIETPEHSWLLVPDAGTNQVMVMERDSLKRLESF